MKPSVRELAELVIGIAWITTTAVSAFAEQVEIVTYYPAPAATTDDLKVKRASVGTTYQALNFDDALNPVADGTLLVEHGLGIGTPTLHNGGIAPSGQPGILDVQDIWLRGANAWASEAVAGEPTKPITLGFGFGQIPKPDGGGPPEGAQAYNAYTALQLWRYGVPANAVRVTRCQAFYPGLPLQLIPSPPHVAPECFASQGNVIVKWNGGVLNAGWSSGISAYIETDVTW